MKTNALFVIILLLFTACADQPQDMTEEWERMNSRKQESIDWFTGAKYGMFIHWGIFSVPAGVWNGKCISEMGHPMFAEWLPYVAKIPRDDWAKLASEFNPVEFDAEAIVRLAKDAGMKYLVITTKHHDGFAMYHSKASKFNIVDATPFKRDVVKELYDACKKHDIRFGIYYSHNIDWADGGDCQYSVIQEINKEKGLETRVFGANLWDPSPNTFDEYLHEKAYPQVKELLTMFPDMIALWYDMAQYILPEQSFEFYRLATSIQPRILINERVGNDFGDYDIPGDNVIPVDPGEKTKPWETVGTLNNVWGYTTYCNEWKSPKELLYWLVDIVSKGGNYMLNIGPTASGKVPVESIVRLKEIGEWLAINGEAIYHTTHWKTNHEGPTKIEIHGTTRRQLDGFKAEFSPEDFWFTARDNNIYAIALEVPESRQILIRSLKGTDADEIESVGILGSNEKPGWELSSEGLKIRLPETLPSTLGYVIAISKKTCVLRNMIIKGI